MRRTCHLGFTLIELLVTMAIVAILVAIAFPSFQGSFRSNRVAAANNEFIGSLNLARTEAIRSTRSAGVCAANPAGTACVGGGTWNDGWLVWTNTNADLDFQAGVDTLVRHVQARPGIVMTVPASNGVAPLDTRILFDSRGRALNTPAAGRVIALKPDTCPAGNQLLREMKLTPVGQINTTKKACV